MLLTYRIGKMAVLTSYAGVRSLLSKFVFSFQTRRFQIRVKIIFGMSLRPSNLVATSAA